MTIRERMLDIRDIANVQVSREQISRTTKDLHKIAVLSKHTNFELGVLYKEYLSLTDMLSDGFIKTDFAYISVARILSQRPRVESVIVGIVESDDYVSEITSLLSVNDKWLYLITDETSDLGITAIAELVETQGIIYAYSSSDAKCLRNGIDTDIASTLMQKGLNNTIGFYTKDVNLVSPEAAWVGRFATSGVGGSVWIHKSLSTLTPESFSNTQANNLKNKNLHFYTMVGDNPSVEGNAVTASGENIFVILGVMWLKSRLSERAWQILYSKDRVSYNNSSADVIKAEVVGVLSDAVSRNILSSDIPFTVSAPDVNSLSSSVRGSGVLSNIKFRARLAGALLFIDNIDGVIQVGEKQSPPIKQVFNNYFASSPYPLGESNRKDAYMPSVSPLDITLKRVLVEGFVYGEDAYIPSVTPLDITLYREKIDNPYIDPKEGYTPSVTPLDITLKQILKSNHQDPKEGYMPSVTPLDIVLKKVLIEQMESGDDAYTPSVKPLDITLIKG